MVSHTKISVVLASYNGDKYILEQLQSIQAQTLQAYEVIVQDDCSSDSTLLIVRQFIDVLPLKIFVNEKNLGYIKNFELATQRATGDYIVLCDQDDIWESHKLSSLIENIKDSDLIYSDSLLVDSDGRSMDKTLSQRLKCTCKSTKSPLAFTYGNCVSAHAMMFKKTLLSSIFPFPETLFFDAWIAANAASVNGIVYYDECLVRYRQHASNVVGTKKIKKSIFTKIAEKALKKRLDNRNMELYVSDLLNIPFLCDEDRLVLQKIVSHHRNFDNCFFNFAFYRLLKRHKSTIFLFANNSGTVSCIKKAIGFKLYRIFPFL